MSEENWRPNIDVQTFLGQSKRRAAIDQRRPSARRAADLVGPGINSSAVRVSDWNNALAMFNGFYLSRPGAFNAPTIVENFIGHTIMDEEFGGTQTVTGLASRIKYTRVFLRNPTDANTVVWGSWVRELSLSDIRADFETTYNTSRMSLQSAGANVSISGGLQFRMDIGFLSGSATFNTTQTKSNQAVQIGEIANSDYAPAETLQFSTPLSGAGAGGAAGMLTITSAGVISVTPLVDFTTVRLTGSWPRDRT